MRRNYYVEMIAELIKDESFIHYISTIIELYVKRKPTWIYGGGENGTICKELLLKLGYDVLGIVDRNASEKKHDKGILYFELKNIYFQTMRI